ncbi:MAG: extracellular solute-binding protein [Anaerolineae bacterium]|nr:extracellular solute-binding protein [Anaerolineae bacterium]
MSKSTVLRGITWNHSRGFVPLVATSQRYAELNPGVEIIWEKRSLQAFADHPIQTLTEQYDLLVIDHPWAGFAASSRALLNLGEVLPPTFLADQAANTVGKSHQSYVFGGYQCALAIDAATPVASWRPDLLEKAGETVPQTWQDLLALARKGLVVFPGIPIDTLMNFYMLCCTQDEPPFVENEWAVSDTTAAGALEQLRELASLCTPDIFNWNPIRVYETLATTDRAAYCPFAYGYSNYSRQGYAEKLLIFGDTVTIAGHGHCSTTLGGTGLAISASSKHCAVATDYARFTAAGEIQKTLYVENGGQPGHRSAWLDPAVNARTHNYFLNTLPTLDNAYLRPRYGGYMHFQDHAGDVVRNYLLYGGDTTTVIADLKRLFEESTLRGIAQ